jgi:hypothetical protein
MATSWGDANWGDGTWGGSNPILTIALTGVQTGGSAGVVGFTKSSAITGVYADGFVDFVERALWNVIDASQAPVWSTGNTAQAANWTPVDAAQNPAWEEVVV